MATPDSKTYGKETLVGVAVTVFAFFIPAIEQKLGVDLPDNIVQILTLAVAMATGGFLNAWWKARRVLDDEVTKRGL